MVTCLNAHNCTMCRSWPGSRETLGVHGRKGIRVSLSAWYHEPNADEDQLEQEEKCKKILWPWGFGFAWKDSRELGFQIFPHSGSYESRKQGPSLGAFHGGTGAKGRGLWSTVKPEFLQEPTWGKWSWVKRIRKQPSTWHPRPAGLPVSLHRSAFSNTPYKWSPYVVLVIGFFHLA